LIQSWNKAQEVKSNGGVNFVRVPTCFMYGINETDSSNIVHWLEFEFKNVAKFNFDSYRSNAIHILYEEKTKYKFYRFNI
jgi:hypothetical protein